MQGEGVKRLFKFTVLTQIIGLPLGAGVSFLFGTWTPFMAALLVMIALDIISGVAKGFYNKELRSRTMSQGMIRKGMIILVIILANMLDMIVFNGLPIAKTGACSFYIGMEGLSFVENLGQMGVQLPNFVKKYLLVLKEKGNEIVEQPSNDESETTK
jgi:toxin secretion/phage lysis holin